MAEPLHTPPGPHKESRCCRSLLALTWRWNTPEVDLIRAPVSLQLKIICSNTSMYWCLVTWGWLSHGTQKKGSERGEGGPSYCIILKIFPQRSGDRSGAFRSSWIWKTPLLHVNACKNHQNKYYYEQWSGAQNREIKTSVSMLLSPPISFCSHFSQRWCQKNLD